MNWLQKKHTACVYASICNGCNRQQLSNIEQYYTLREASTALALISTPTTTTDSIADTPTKSIDTLSTTSKADTAIDDTQAETSTDESILEFIHSRIASIKKGVKSKFGRDIIIETKVYTELGSKLPRLER